MKIPNIIRIGGVDYAVVETEKLNDGARMCYGHIDGGALFDLKVKAE